MTLDSPSPAPMRQLPLPLAIAPEPSFDNFLPGANEAVLAHLRSLVGPMTGERTPPEGAAVLPPVYLWGPAGSGKTHLLRALCRAVELAGGATRTIADADPVGEPASTTAPRLVTIDGCDALGEPAQALAFRAFVDAASSGTTRIVAAGRVPPVDLALREDLRSRLGWGPVFALAPLADAQTRDALQREATRRGIVLGDGVLDHLLTRFARDLKHLMALLDRLDRYALAQSRGATLPLLRQMLGDEEAR
ncbi:MAG: DnaA regulatory inactivator Hda [Rubrivivax sp.]